MAASGSGRRVHVVSLGCAKNRVDTEEMVARLEGGGWSLTPDPAGADVILVNTCAFIRPATQESIDTILELARFKTEGACRRLVVAGCLPERYRDALTGELPEVDAFVGVPERKRILEVLDAPADADLPRGLFGTTPIPDDDVTPRTLSALGPSAYLKISDGCNHRCAFCVIPSIRGPLRSRPLASLLDEARVLIGGGVRELNLVAQDTTAYGRDRHDGATLVHLLESLCALDGLVRLRLLYAFPTAVSDDLLRVIKDQPRICRYLDIPLQHAADPVLRAMRRGVSAADQKALVDRIRSTIPEMTLRTTFIVGFPGETDEDFAALLSVVDRDLFDRVGIFQYHDEEGSLAASLPGKVPARVKRQRFRALVNAVARSAARRQRTRIGQTLEVLVDGPSDQADAIWEGRTEGQAPDVDGRVYFGLSPDAAPPRPGDLVHVRIEQSTEVDLSGTLVTISD